MAYRRELLAAISGTGLVLTAGCLGNTTPTNGEDDDGNPEDFNREVTLLGYDETPDEVPFAFETASLSSTLSQEAKPRFELTVRNTVDSEHILVVDDGRRHIVPHFSEPSGLRTIAADEYEVARAATTNGNHEGHDGNADEDTGCLSVAALPRDSDDFLAAHNFDPHQEETAEYAIVGGGGLEGTCPEPSEYELRAEMHLNPPNIEDDAAEPEIEFEWGFSAEVA